MLDLGGFFFLKCHVSVTPNLIFCNCFSKNAIVLSLKVVTWIYVLFFNRVDRKERARLKNVKFTGKTSEKVKSLYILFYSMEMLE